MCPRSSSRKIFSVTLCLVCRCGAFMCVRVHEINNWNLILRQNKSMYTKVRNVSIGIHVFIKTKWGTNLIIFFPFPSVCLSQNVRFLYKLRWNSRTRGTHIHSPVVSVISEILGNFQAGEGGGIFHAGDAVPARLTPSRLQSAAGEAEAPGSFKPASISPPTVRSKTGSQCEYEFTIKAGTYPFVFYRKIIINV